MVHNNLTADSNIFNGSVCIFLYQIPIECQIQIQFLQEPCVRTGLYLKGPWGVKGLPELFLYCRCQLFVYVLIRCDVCKKLSAKLIFHLDRGRWQVAECVCFFNIADRGQPYTLSLNLRFLFSFLLIHFFGIIHFWFKDSPDEVLPPRV